MLCFRNEIGSTTAGIAGGRTSAVLCLRVIRSECLDIFLRLLLGAFTLSHALVAVAQRSEAKPLPSTPPDDTDWTYYCDPSHEVEALDQLKCIGGKNCRNIRCGRIPHTAEGEATPLPLGFL
jgi:hypothetical protein